MPYACRRNAAHSRPLSDMNITPLIDVMLVLLIMFIMVIPIATHSLLVPLPNGKGDFDTLPTNTVRIDAADRLYWNGNVLDRQQLLNQLAEAATLPEQPLVRFEPDRSASYARSSATIALIKDAGIERFAFVGNERYRDFNGD